MASSDTNAAFGPIIIQVSKGVLGLVELHGSVFEALSVFFVVVASDNGKNEDRDRKGHHRFGNDLMHGFVV